ncbi:MAG: exodeoxyribonuclease VII small subunit [Clostridia bacterium]|nr:exodeoxyribonuclease VII small subunit [Clostridia bacterium]
MKDEKSFEELIDDLENIAELLESDKLNLDESIQKFEEGMKTARLCNEKLENAEKKINILLEKNGEIIEEKFNVGEE